MNMLLLNPNENPYVFHGVPKHIKLINNNKIFKKIDEIMIKAYFYSLKYCTKVIFFHYFYKWFYKAF